MPWVYGWYQKPAPKKRKKTTAKRKRRKVDWDTIEAAQRDASRPHRASGYNPHGYWDD